MDHPLFGEEKQNQSVIKIDEILIIKNSLNSQSRLKDERFIVIVNFIFFGGRRIREKKTKE